MSDTMTVDKLIKKYKVIPGSPLEVDLYALIDTEFERAATACRDEGLRYGRVDRDGEQAGCFKCESRILAQIWCA